MHESLGALEVRLSDGEMSELESTASAVAGTRCDAMQMRILDSEK